MIRRRLAAALVFLCLPAVAQAQVVLQLKDSFIEKYKNRVTIEANLTIDHSHKSPKTPSTSKPSNDGDIHASARTASIGLPIVAELMNAVDAKDQIKVFVDAAESGEKVKTSGAWRLWCEHGGVVDQIQGKNWPKAENTNPDHCFEIHPLTAVEDVDVGHTWKPIPGFKNKDAESAFEKYENLRAEIFHNGSKKTTTIQTSALGYNYVEFILELEEDPTFLVSDGLILRASVYTLDGELLTRHRRMVFAKDTPPYDQIKTLKKGEAARVLGMPRLNLAVVSWRVRESKTRPSVLRWNLPYEMVIIGFYERIQWEDQ